MKQVSSVVYNSKYFSTFLKSPDFSHPVNGNQFKRKYHETALLLPISTSTRLVDFGCGDGDYCFYLDCIYKPTIVGIDYSKDAIKICQTKLKNYKKYTNPKAKIKFYNRNNNQLPKLKHIDYVFALDVFEHLYDHEIKTILKSFESWNHNIKIIIHTDNTIYLNYVAWIFDLLEILIKKTSLKEIRRRYQLNSKMHVNLTNPWILARKMKKWGYRENKRWFPQANDQTIISQLGELGKIKLINKGIKTILKHCNFLAPSFYAVYEKTT